MDSVLTVYKPLGKTPLEVIDQLRIVYPQYRHERIGYAGRLDPMAEGVIVLLIGEANTQRKGFDEKDKSYRFQYLLGISTDTYDLLGLVGSEKPTEHITHEMLAEITAAWPGEREQLYPPFSSMTVSGKPLYWWARQQRLKEITIPSRRVIIHASTFIACETISARQLLNAIESRTALVRGDFRQEVIRARWQEVLKQSSHSFPLVTAEISCSSGTYVRAIVSDLGIKLGCGATTYSILRTRVDDYTLEKALRVF